MLLKSYEMCLCLSEGKLPCVFCLLNLILVELWNICYWPSYLWTLHADFFRLPSVSVSSPLPPQEFYILISVTFWLPCFSASLTIAFHGNFVAAPVFAFFVHICFVVSHLWNLQQMFVSFHIILLLLIMPLWSISQGVDTRFGPTRGLLMISGFRIHMQTERHVLTAKRGKNVFPHVYYRY